MPHYSIFRSRRFFSAVGRGFSAWFWEIYILKAVGCLGRWSTSSVEQIDNISSGGDSGSMATICTPLGCGPVHSRSVLEVYLSSSSSPLLGWYDRIMPENPTTRSDDVLATQAVPALKPALLTPLFTPPPLVVDLGVLSVHVQ